MLSMRKKHSAQHRACLIVLLERVTISSADTSSVASQMPLQRTSRSLLTGFTRKFWSPDVDSKHGYADVQFAAPAH